MNLIVAMSRNFAIGRNNKLPWYLPSDLKRFKALTMGNVVVMGRKTFESLTAPLKGRDNLVLSTTLDEKTEGVTVCRTVDECVKKAQTLANQKGCEIFVIGGAEIYRLFMPYVTTLYMTVVDVDIKGEDVVFFPDFDFRVNTSETEFYEKDEKNMYNFRTYKMEVM